MWLICEQYLSCLITYTLNIDLTKTDKIIMGAQTKGNDFLGSGWHGAILCNAKQKSQVMAI